MQIPWYARGLVYHVISGQAFFSGAAMVMAAVCLSWLSEKGWVRKLRDFLAVVGMALAALSATPLAPALWGALIVVAALWMTAEWFQNRVPSRILMASRGLAIVAWLSAMVVEAPYHFMPRVPLLGEPILGIIGDSVTAGLGERGEVTWPRLFAQRHDVVVRDHAQAGANVASALRQAEELGSDEELVLLEIGGNDVLGYTSPEQFENGLEALLGSVCQSDRTVVMLEIPLPPTFNAFGRTQRRLAARFGVILVPKRVLLGVLLQADTTLDSIHLSPEGHQRMAVAMWRVLKGAYSGAGRSTQELLARFRDTLRAGAEFEEHRSASVRPSRGPTSGCNFGRRPDQRSLEKLERRCIAQDTL